MDKAIIKDAKDKMEAAEEALKREFSKLRSGKASTALVDTIKVDCYGSKMMLNQVANVATPEPRLLTIQPWDKGMISAIEKAILQSELGITPANDGATIRLPIPALNEERRKDLVKLIHKYSEEGRVSIRNARRDAIARLETFEKEKKITEDDLRRTKAEMQKLTDKAIKDIDDLMKHKEKEIMEV